MAIVDDYKQEQKEIEAKTNFVNEFNRSLDKFEQDNIKLTDLLEFVAVKNKKYTLNGFKDYSIMVRVEDEEFETSYSRYNKRKNVVIYIKSKDKDSRISIAMYRSEQSCKFLLNQDGSYFDFKFVSENLDALLKFIFYGEEN